MYWANVSGNSIEVSGRGALVVGNANANSVIFSFSAEWVGLRRIAVFKNSINMIAVDVPSSQIVYIPWECCEEVDDTVYLGAYGLDDEGTVKRPTTWAAIGKIVDGVNIDSAGHSDPTKSIFIDLLNKVDSLSRDVLGSDANMDEVSLAIENLESTATDHMAKITALEEDTELYSYHRNLKGRDEVSQHPVSSIEGLEAAVGEDLTPADLNELLGIGGEST